MAYEFPGICQVGKQDVSGLQCKNCAKMLPEQYVMNRVSLFLKQLIQFYYSGNHIILSCVGACECHEPSCGAKSRQLLVNGNKCVNATCKGKMQPEYSEQQTNDTLRYLQGLFNVRKHINERKLGQQEHEFPNYQQFNLLRLKVDALLDRSGYNKVDLKSIFAFMAK